MSLKLLFRRANVWGGTVDLAANGWDEKSAPLFDEGRTLVELGHRYYEGQASQGTFILRDPDADLGADFPQGHTLITLTEDAPGAEVWLSRGRVGTDEGGRGLVKEEDVLEWTVTVEDGNCDLRGQAFTESWVRPEETDIQRLVALQLYTLNGASSTATNHRATCSITINTSHLAPNSNTVNMPAKKYLPGTQPEEVVRDCADTAGKQWGVVIHHTGGSHLCLLYIVNADHTTFLSPAKISDHFEDWDPDDTSAPILEPHWEQGVGAIHQMQTLLSGLVGIWGSGEQSTYIEYVLPIEDNYDYWVDAYHDGVSTTAGQAAIRTAGILEGRRNSHVSHRVSVLMNADQVDLICAGMSIQIKSAVTSQSDPDAYVTRRIGEARFEPLPDGRYFCHMDLERPPLRVAPGRGQVGPIPPVQSEPGGGPTTDFLWTFESTHFDDTTGLYPVGGGSANSQWHAGYVHAHVLHPGIGNGSSSPRPPITPGTYHFRAIIKGNETYGPVGIRVDAWDSGVNQGSVWDSGDTVGITPETVESDIVFPAGTDQFTFGTYRDVGSANASTIYEVELTHGTSTPGFEGTPAPPAATGDTGSIGTSPIYSPSDHQHLAQDASATGIDDAGGYFEGGNVEEALQELGAGGGVAAPETPFHEHDLPHGYVLEKQGIVIQRGGSGSWKEALVESPNVFWYPPKGQYGMVFVGYSGAFGTPTEAAIGVAWADSPDGPWTEPGTNPLFTKSGAGNDSHGTSGPFIWYEDGTTHLFYIGLTASGYEQGTKTICHAYTTDSDLETATWTRDGAVIEPDGSGWRSTAIWHPNIVKRGSYYMFFNATGSVTERIGYATSLDLMTWTVDDTNSPVLSEGAAAEWDDTAIGDPYVYRIGETWYMAYFGWAGAFGQDGVAFTSDRDFPLGWTKFEGNPILTPGTGADDDSRSAFKPSIWITPTKLYHWYTAVNDDTEEIQIALATQEVGGVLETDIMDIGHWEVIVAGTAPPVAVTNEAEDDWIYGWVPG